MLVKQASFRNHDDVAGAQPDIALEIVSGFISSVVEHEDRFVAAGATPPHLNAVLSQQMGRCRRPSAIACISVVGCRTTYDPGLITSPVMKIFGFRSSSGMSFGALATATVTSRFSSL